MKKKIFVYLLAVSFLFPSCATILGGKVQDNQRIKPQAGEPQRKLRAGYFIADLVLIPVIGFIVDFSTGAIYQPK